ncbi:uncharacterized protein LOC126373215 isoform X2 [Pectinophora gossypiella]|nr:uncharacterized protein LOC126373215 isoform X2 [Pectinophora gossypiella]
MGILLLLSSVLLLIGISKKKPGFLLFYFGYGLFFTILCNIGALLLLLKCMWWTSGAIFIASLVYIHFLVVVQTVYDGMLRGKVYGFASHRKLDDDIAILEGSLNDVSQE